MMEAYNPRGVALLCDVVREQVESLPCPGCGQALDGVEIEPQEVTEDHVTLELSCRSCRTQFHIEVEPASESGVAVVR